jgi:5'-3' exonuclease
LIAVAFLVGSDYTEGVENVGIVKAVEILQEFEGQGFEKLKNFK